MKQMSNLIKKTVGIAVIFLFVNTIFAGNPQRSGQAGASELLINPWAQSSGMAGANTASSRGLESVYLNVAGLTGVEGTELSFSHASWFADISINVSSASNDTKVGSRGVLLKSVWNASSSGSGIVRVYLIHQPTNFNATNREAFGGFNDVAIDIPVTVSD